MANASSDRPRVHAAIELSGKSLRYAEVDLGARRSALRDHDGPPPRARLSRLGACDFEFDVAAAILDPAGPTYLETVVTALREIFDGSTADALSVVVHPWQATSFLVPLPADMPVDARFEQVRQEAAMLADARHGRPVRVTATPFRREATPDGRDFHWHHVLHVADVVHARAHQLAKHIRAEMPHAFVDSTAAVAALPRGPEENGELDDQAFCLTLGSYGGYMEVALTRNGGLYFSHVAEVANSPDGAYYVLALLDKLEIEPADVRHVEIHGEGGYLDVIRSIEGVLGRESRTLNPLAQVDRSTAAVDASMLSAFAPVLGAAMKG